jgi:hypothetical protein
MLACFLLKYPWSVIPAGMRIPITLFPSHMGNVYSPEVGSPAFAMISDRWQNGRDSRYYGGSDQIVKNREGASLTGIRKQKIP